jgi:hypothetical protein
VKFDCGETWEEKKTRLAKWHKVFVIFPRRVGIHDCRWLETIERKGELFVGIRRFFWSWEYRAIKK